MSETIKKRQDVVFAGVGGQGIITATTILSQVGLEHYNYVTEFPQYTATMRGGPCFSTVVLSDEPIRSPIISKLSTVVALELGGYSSFEKAVRDGGTLIVNTSQVKKMREKSADYRLIQVPATDLADEVGSVLSTNYIMLGVYLVLTEALPFEVVEESIAEKAKTSEFDEVNLAALKKGREVGLAL